MKKSDLRDLALELGDQVNGFFVDPQRTLVINGFWRSGTTWLQECTANILQAKSIFEPFQARAGYILKCLDEIAPNRRDYEFCNALMPYVTDSLAPKTQLFKLVNQAQRGQLTQKFVLRNQPRNLARCFNQQVVVKYTRGALALRAIVNTFSCPVIHIYRDPRAVIASIKKTQKNWGEGAFANFSLSAHLLAVNDGRYDYFKQWKSEIDAIEKTNDYGRLAAYYCLTEKHLAESFANKGSERFVAVSYENLVMEGYPKLIELLKEIGVKVRSINVEAFKKPSSTQYKSKQGYFTQEERLFNWKTKLNNEEAQTIKSVVETFGMQRYLID